MKIDELVKKQKAYFASGATLEPAFRKEQLRKLWQAVRNQQQAIGLALEEDLGKSRYESYMCEIGMVLEELSYMISHLEKFSRRRRVHTPLAQFSAKSFVMPSPRGCVLMMSPWNYPFLLTLGPLADGLAAGNTAVVKPSAYAPATGNLVKKLLESCFPQEYVAVVTGGREENRDLLCQKFDLVFFTGSQAVGREVLQHTAENLTPAILELGGKSPCIVDETAKIPLAARRIVWGKFLNCGQTCVAPDYVLCQQSIEEELVAAIEEEIRHQFGVRPLHNPNYGKMINEKHFNRVCRLMDGKKLVHGGEADPVSLRISPSVMKGVTFEDPVMQEEIFGPLLPVLTYREAEEIPEMLADLPKPLAFYVFTENRRRAQWLMERCSFGGGCINDTVIHLATTAMGFGGVGESGMGAYHGKTGFDAFSHCKSIVNKRTWLDLPVRYQPYSSPVREKLLHRLMK